MSAATVHAPSYRRRVSFGALSADEAPWQNDQSPNLFRDDVGLLTPSDVVVAQGFADVATIAILQNESSISARLLNTQLSFALNSRIIIEQAKGMISQSTTCSMDEAFGRLRLHARNHNLRLTAVATDVVEGLIRIETLDRPK